jgi:hypothetical protein
LKTQGSGAIAKASFKVPARGRELFNGAKSKSSQVLKNVKNRANKIRK